MRLITYNVNGLRAAMAKGWLDWLKKANPDVLCVQEIKAHPTQLPLTLFENMGYHTYWHSAKKRGYSGVGILTKTKPKEVLYGCQNEDLDNEGRFLCVRTKDLNIVSLYLPSGSSGDNRQKFKMKCLPHFEKYIKELITPEFPHLALGGDFNICHKTIDIHDPIRNATNSGFLPEERQWMNQLLKKHKLIDSFRYLNPYPNHYTWWSFRSQARKRNLGWRIDYWLLSENLKQQLNKTILLAEIHFSDHCPVLLELTSNA